LAFPKNIFHNLENPEAIDAEHHPDQSGGIFKKTVNYDCLASVRPVYPLGRSLMRESYIT
jgi:hypothetical protein